MSDRFSKSFATVFRTLITVVSNRRYLCAFVGYGYAKTMYYLITFTTTIPNTSSYTIWFITPTIRCELGHFCLLENDK